MAVARPMPAEAPVIKTTLSFSSMRPPFYFLRPSRKSPIHGIKAYFMVQQASNRRCARKARIGVIDGGHRWGGERDGVAEDRACSRLGDTWRRRGLSRPGRGPLDRRSYRDA